MENRFGFTRARLDKATCPADGNPNKRAYFYDDGEPGLCLQVTAAGAKSFYLYRKINGRPERIRLGAYPDISINDARSAAQVHKGKIANGINPAEELRTRRSAMTLAELFTHYIDTHARHHKKRWEDDKAQFERYFGKAERQPDDKPTPFPGWRTRQVNTISTEDVKALHVKLGEKHGKYSANRMLALLSSMFNNAGLFNPTKGVKKFREEQRERFLDTEELPRFFAALDAEPDKAFSDYFKLLLFTMARRSNVAAMRWADVSFGKRQWAVAGEKTKNGDPLVVSLTDEAMEILQQRWNQRTEGDEHVFPSRGTTGHLVEPKAAWSRILERAKITNLHIHDLRHTGASWMAIGGSSLPIIGKALGHRSSQSTARYAHVNRSAAATAVQAATANIMALATTKPAPPVKTSGRGTKKKSA